MTDKEKWVIKNLREYIDLECAACPFGDVQKAALSMIQELIDERDEFRGKQNDQQLGGHTP